MEMKVPQTSMSMDEERIYKQAIKRYFDRQLPVTRTNLKQSILSMIKSFMMLNTESHCTLCKGKHLLKDCLPFRKLEHSFLALGGIYSLLWTEIKLEHCWMSVQGTATG